jgi:hypothetical protein
MAYNLRQNVVQSSGFKYHSISEAAERSWGGPAGPQRQLVSTILLIVDLFGGVVMMARLTRRTALLWFALACVLCLASGLAAQVSQDLYSGLRWRNIGPFHGGRISAVTGVIGQPGVYYFGTPMGGI